MDSTTLMERWAQAKHDYLTVAFRGTEKARDREFVGLLAAGTQDAFDAGFKACLAALGVEIAAPICPRR